eukprot:TRINITY_DN7419_c0_g1_i1.p4 TRINITY_DN7419_c0_g1~~TRINITY_DN7419_c0_g1_i1.p4  ORF type:complete len:116 (+),score=37.04 TRINITY_DN7419_c0_g1_i1:171-518(+)
MLRSLVGSEMCIRDRYQRRVREDASMLKDLDHLLSSIPTLEVVDTHCAGEPARIVIGGLPEVPGADMYEKRVYFMEHLDNYRKLLLLEPRGYPCQNADLVVPATLPEAAFGSLIL